MTDEERKAIKALETVKDFCKMRNDCEMCVLEDWCGHYKYNDIPQDWKDIPEIEEVGEEKMTEIKKYVCDLCKTEYSTEEKCRKCEERHKTPVKIKGYVHENDCATYETVNFPMYVGIEFQDGEVATYRIAEKGWWGK